MRITKYEIKIMQDHKLDAILTIIIDDEIIVNNVKIINGRVFFPYNFSFCKKSRRQEISGIVKRIYDEKCGEEVQRLGIIGLIDQ